MQIALPRISPLLCMLCLAGCGQTGALFLRMSPVTFGTLPPPIETPQFAPLVPLPALPGDAAPDDTLPVPAVSTHR